MHPTNTFRISRTAKKLLEKIDSMAQKQQKLSQNRAAQAACIQ
jgi:hypothetical protein